MDERPGVTWAAGVAAVALLVILVAAVIRTSGSSDAPAFVPPAPPGGRQFDVGVHPVLVVDELHRAERPDQPGHRRSRHGRAFDDRRSGTRRVNHLGCDHTVVNHLQPLWHDDPDQRRSRLVLTGRVVGR